MSEKRWVLKKDVGLPARNGSTYLRQFHFEEVEVPEANESIVPHAVLQRINTFARAEAYSASISRSKEANVILDLITPSLPKLRPTLREAISSVVEGDDIKRVEFGRLIYALREAGFNPDERKNN